MARQEDCGLDERRDLQLLAERNIWNPHTSHVVVGVLEAQRFGRRTFENQPGRNEGT